MILALSGVPLIIVSIIAFILIIGVIIIVHEGGHFFFARRAGILCHEFSIGMGPVIYKKQFGETTFCIRAIPIGGFVSMAGEEVTSELVKVGNTIGINLENDEISEIILDEDKDCQIRGEVSDVDLYGKNNENLFITILEGTQGKYYPVKRNAFYVFPKDKRMQITPYDRSFESKSLWQRFITIFAGPFMNLILAIFIYIVIAFATGVPNYKSNVIGEIYSGYPAEVLKTGDQIVSVNEETIETWRDFQNALDKSYKAYETNLKIKVIRDGKEVVEYITPYIAINSVGISNFQSPKLNFTELGIPNGLVIGNVSETINKKDNPLSNGDVVTKIKIDNEITEVNSESWATVVELFDKANYVSVQYEYYDYDAKDKTYHLVKLEDCPSIQTWTNEVLENQRIEKIIHTMGVSPVMHFNFFGCIGSAFQNFWNDFTLIFRTLKLLIAPGDVRQIGVSDLSSFVGIFSLVETYIGAGFLALMSFVALLSVNIGVMNLLPIPALDGGRIIFLAYELITKRKPSKKVENIVNNVFFILILILFVYITFHDILRMIK